MSTKDEIVLAAGISLGSAFAAANQPHVETSQPTAHSIKPSCTVRYNRYDDSAPIDERYRNHPSADSTRYKGFTHSGITYTQHVTINGDLPMVEDVSFQAEAGLHNWYMPDGKYYQSPSWTPKLDTWVGSVVGNVKGTLYEAKYTNWTRSVQVDIEDPKSCIRVIDEMAKHGRFSAFGYFSENSNDYANRVWAKTGKPPYNVMIKDPKTTIITREQRIAEDLASGQLKSDFNNLPPAWKP